MECPSCGMSLPRRPSPSMSLLAIRLRTPGTRAGSRCVCAWGIWAVCAGQYPGEKEITFPPFTCLESHGDARLERDAKGNEVVIFPLKVPGAPPHLHPHPTLPL